MWESLNFTIDFTTGWSPALDLRRMLLEFSAKVEGVNVAESMERAIDKTNYVHRHLL